MPSKVQYGFDVRPRGTEPARLRRAGSVVYVNQVHGGDVLVVPREENGQTQVGPGSVVCAGDADGLVTNREGIALVIHTADCVPVLFWSDDGRVIGTAHAGWRGIVAGVVKNMIQKLKTEYGVGAASLRVMIGPAICGRHYDVSTTMDGRIEQFDAMFERQKDVVRREQGRVYLDLPAAVRAQCLRAGMKVEQIDQEGRCVFEDETLPSHRREGEKRTHNLCSWILIQ